MKRSKIQQTSVEVTVGAFLFLILLALGFFTIVLSRENILQKSYQRMVLFEDVSGLTKGDKVYVHGVDVGRVKSMSIHEDGIHVHLSLRKDLKLYENYAISVIPSSILGGRYLDIDPGSKDQPAIPSDAQWLGTTPVDLIAEATAAVKDIRKSLDTGGVLKNLEEVMANLREVTDGLANGEGTIGKLLKDEQVYTELKELSTNLKDITARLNKGEGSLGKLLVEDQVYNDLRDVSANLKKVTDNVAQGKGTIGKLLSEDDTLYKDLSEAASSINSIAGSINRGEGTLGRLAKDEALYDQLNKLIGEIRATVDDIRETSPVATFSSVFFGAF